MHVLRPKHSKIKAEEAKKILLDLNVNISQIPKIKQEDTALPEGCVVGDMVKIERKNEDKIVNYYRVVV